MSLAELLPEAGHAAFSRATVTRERLASVPAFPAGRPAAFKGRAN